MEPGEKRPQDKPRGSSPHAPKMVPPYGRPSLPTRLTERACEVRPLAERMVAIHAAFAAQGEQREAVRIIAGNGSGYAISEAGAMSSPLPRPTRGLRPEPSRWAGEGSETGLLDFRRFATARRFFCRRAGEDAVGGGDHESGAAGRRPIGGVRRDGRSVGPRRDRDRGHPAHDPAREDRRFAHQPPDLAPDVATRYRVLRRAIVVSIVFVGVLGAPRHPASVPWPERSLPLGGARVVSAWQRSGARQLHRRYSIAFPADQARRRGADRRHRRRRRGVGLTYTWLRTATTTCS